MIQDVYRKQLDAILFSVNQYSDDVLNSWIAKVESGWIEKVPGHTPKKIKNLLTFNSSLAAVFISDPPYGAANGAVFSLTDSSKERISAINETLSSGAENIRQLVEYKKDGFQKLQSLPYRDSANNDLRCLAFVVGDQPSQFSIAGLLVDPNIFIQEVVGPRLQIIAKDQFILSVFKKGSPASIYSTLARNGDTLKAEAHTKDLWLLPDFTIGIRANGASIQSLVDKRTTTNLILLLSLDAVLIVAVILVFRNVKHEVQLAQNKADFVSNVSHEIRTPLALISMFAETLEMGRVGSEEKKQEYYSIITKETHRLSGIVNKILSFSQIDANKKNLVFRIVDINTEVNGILKTYDFHLRSKGFGYTFIPGGEVSVQADGEAFAEAVINLIDNAMKYSPDKKFIEITSGIENEYGYVAVKDHGIGISKMDQKHIFDKFFRVSSGDLAKSLGTGLGLSLVKQLTEAQHGHVTVSSAPGKGSVFTLYFLLKKTES